MSEFIDNSLAEDSEDEVEEQQQQQQQIELSQNHPQELEEEEHYEESINYEIEDNTIVATRSLESFDGNFMSEYDTDKRENDYNTLTVLINTLEEELARIDDNNEQELQARIEQNKNLRLQVEKLLCKPLADLHSGIKEQSTTEFITEEVVNKEQKLSEFAKSLVLLEIAYRTRLEEEEEDQCAHILWQTSQEMKQKLEIKKEQYKKLIQYMQTNKERVIQENTQPLTQYISEFLTNKIANLLQLENEFIKPETISTHKTVNTKQEIKAMLQEHVLSSWSSSREDENRLFVVLAERVEKELELNIELEEMHQKMKRQLQQLMTVTSTFNIKLEKYYTALLEEIMFPVGRMNGKRTRTGMPVVHDRHMESVSHTQNTLNDAHSPLHNENAAPTVSNNTANSIYNNKTRYECDVQAKLIGTEIQLLSTYVQHDMQNIQRMIMCVRSQMSTERLKEKLEDSLLLSLTYTWLQHEVNTWRRWVEWQRVHLQNPDVSFATLLENCSYAQNEKVSIDDNRGEENGGGDVKLSLRETNTFSSDIHNETEVSILVRNCRQLINFIVLLTENAIETLQSETHIAWSMKDNTTHHIEIKEYIENNDSNDKNSNSLTPFASEDYFNANALHMQPIKWFQIPSLLLLQGVVELQDVCLHSFAQINAAYRKNAHWCTLMKFFALQAIGKNELNELDDVQLREEIRSTLESLDITSNTDEFSTLGESYKAYVLLSSSWRNNYISNMERKFANVLSSNKNMLQSKCHALTQLRVLLLHLIQEHNGQNYGNTLPLSTESNTNVKYNTLEMKLMPLPKLHEEATWPSIHDSNKIHDSMEIMISNAVHSEQERITQALNEFLKGVNEAVTEEHENTTKKLMWIEQHPQGQMLLKLRHLLTLNHTLRLKLEEKISAFTSVAVSSSSFVDTNVDKDENADMSNAQSMNKHNDAHEEQDEEKDSKNNVLDQKDVNANEELIENEEEEEEINAKIAQLEELISHQKLHAKELEHKVKALSEELAI